MMIFRCFLPDGFRNPEGYLMRGFTSVQGVVRSDYLIYFTSAPLAAFFAPADP